MRINGTELRSIARAGGADAVTIIDQTLLPGSLTLAEISSVPEVIHAIKTMMVRGAPLIGATGAYGISFQCREDASDEAVLAAATAVKSARPTAVDLEHYVDQIVTATLAEAMGDRADFAWAMADSMAEKNAVDCRLIGEHGLNLIRAFHEKTDRPVQLMTHCNAGWLATVDWGTALSPMFMAEREGIPIHVWVSETRPRCQGALTAFELGHEGIAHTYVVDNAAGVLMRDGKVDVVITGADRITRDGSVFNKVGTSLKAFAAKHYAVPYWAAAPLSTWDFARGADEIEIEERGAEEVCMIGTERLTPAEDTKTANPAFDETPAEYVSRYITETGVFETAGEVKASC